VRVANGYLVTTDLAGAAQAELGRRDSDGALVVETG
jgi:hypothetical protein